MRTRLSTFLSSWQLSDRDRRRLLAALTAVVCLSHVVGILMTSGLNGRMIQGDANGYFAYLPSVVLDGDLDLRNQFERLRPERGDPQRPFGGTDTDAANPFSVGSAILWLPGYLDVLQPSKSDKSAFGRVDPASSHAATSNSLWMN